MSDVPPWLSRLVDDAAIFPPGDVPLPEALQAYAGHPDAAHSALVGSFVISDVRLPELAELAPAAGFDADHPLPLAVVVTGGAGAVAPAVTWAHRNAAVELRAVEVALRDLDDLPGNARRVVAATDALAEELSAVDVFVEVPWQVGRHGWEAALDEVAVRELRLKLRTGGTSADAFPSAREVAEAVDAALDRELAFKCTAGLHHALRHTDVATRFEHHGFLNVLLATRAALDGDDVVAVLEERSADALAAAATTQDLAGARRWFTGFGSCSVTEPYDDLVALGLLGEEPGLIGGAS